MLLKFYIYLFVQVTLRSAFIFYNLNTMYPGGYTAEVTSLSPRATEKDVYDFFSHCGAIEHVEMVR